MKTRTTSEADRGMVKNMKMTVEWESSPNVMAGDGVPALGSGHHT